jgi:hypothetical protein
MKQFLASLMSLTFLFSCQLRQSGSGNGMLTALRPLTTDERAADFDQMTALFKEFYGPYEYKERTLKIKIADVTADLKAKAIAAQTDEEFAGYVMAMGAALKDGHVQISVENTSSGVMKYSIPVLLTPIEGRAIVGDVAPELAATFEFAIGDEVLAVDGQAPSAYLPKILKYRALARPESEQHYIAFVLSRPSYMTDMKPTQATVNLKIKKANGSEIVVDIPWQQTKFNKDLDQLLPIKNGLDLSVPFANDLNHIVDNHIRQMGDVNPIFVTENVLTVFKFVKVYPSDASRKKFGLADKEIPPIYAALYKYGGKNILLVRQASYDPSDFSSEVYLKTYMALMSEYEALADVLVLDQTHNPGGSYCADFYNLFAHDGDVQSVQLMNADRKWINDLKVNYVTSNPHPKVWENALLESWGLQVEQAYDAGVRLSTPVPIFTGSKYAGSAPYRWTKPMLVLIDELAGSCGDMFPMIVKANNRAKLFGQRTMGLGGNVEEVGTLNNSRIKVKMTRGMFYAFNPNRAPLDSEFIENNGVLPDIPYVQTVEDFRLGYPYYVKAFSDAAISGL